MSLLAAENELGSIYYNFLPATIVNDLFDNLVPFKNL